MARTVAVRRRASEQRDLAEPLPRAERGDDAPVADDLGLARLDHEVAVADVPLAGTPPARRARRPVPGRGRAARWRAAAARSAWRRTASVAMSRSRTSMDRSIRRSRGQDAMAHTGHSSPTTTSAGRTPDSPITRDVTIAPIPMNRATRLSSTPKTRASTSSGASRASSVKPPRSISELPTPTQASRPSAATWWGKTPISVTGMPHRATPTANQAPRRRVLDQQRRPERAQDRAGPDAPR